MKSWNNTLSLSFVLFLILIACKPKETKKELEDITPLLGRWQIKEALRNGQKTGTLDSAFFEFKPDFQLATNLLGTEENGIFEFKKDNLIQKTSQEINYGVERLDTNTLILTTKLRNFDFKFILEKHK